MGKCLVLLTIIDICLAPVVTNDMAADLEVLSRDQHVIEQFSKCYCNEERAFILKQQFMVHYPEWVRK